jgi:ribonuclease HI
MKITLYTDGGCSGNDQPDLAKRQMIAVVALTNGDVVVDKHQEGGSNNIAELLAVKEALLWASVNGYKDVKLKTDSRNNFAWVFGKKVGKHLNDRDHVLALKSSIAGILTDVKLEMFWVPRGENIAGHYIEQQYNL